MFEGESGNMTPPNLTKARGCSRCFAAGNYLDIDGEPGLFGHGEYPLKTCGFRGVNPVP